MTTRRRPSVAPRSRGGAVRVWESVDVAPGAPVWAILSRDEWTGTTRCLLSNAPETVSPEAMERALATAQHAMTCSTQRESASLDVYRVRGWEGWHRHVTLAILASALRAGLSAESEDAPAEAASAEPTTYRLDVALAETDWRPVRALQVLLAVEEVGEVLESLPSRAEIERQEVADRMQVILASAAARERLLGALAESRRSRSWPWIPELSRPRRLSRPPSGRDGRGR